MNPDDLLTRIIARFCIVAAALIAGITISTGDASGIVIGALALIVAVLLAVDEVIYRRQRHRASVGAEDEEAR